MTIDERIEALTMNLELAHQDIQDLKAASQQDGQNIRDLAPIASEALDSIKRLERVATAYDQGLDRPEE